LTGSAAYKIDPAKDARLALCRISRAAELLGEDEDLALNMEPEDGCLWIHGTDDHQTMAFTAPGLEYLRELIAEP
jgi:hypothetical protein